MKKGFTLIELLIVIAIIGILATVVLVNSSSAQNKAKEQSGRQTMRSALTQMILCKNGGGSNTDYQASQLLCDDTSASDANWPELPGACTSFVATAGTNVFTGVCGGVTITCDAGQGSCI